MNAVREIRESHWKSFADSDLQGKRSGRRTATAARANLKRKIAIRRKPNSRFKGAPEIAGMMFKPKSWNKARRYRWMIVDKDDQQLYLDDGLRRTSTDRGEQLEAQQRAGGCESPRGVATRRTSSRTQVRARPGHIPTGSLAANQATS